MTKSMKTQEKLVKTVTSRFGANQKLNEISELLTDSDTCVATLSQVSNLTNANLEKINDKDGNTIYSVGQLMQAGKIEEMKILDYTAGPGLRRHKLNLQVKIRYPQADMPNNSSSFGGKAKNFSVPLYVVTKDNSVKVCLSDTSEIIEDALTLACTQFGGSMDSGTGVCTGVIGPDGVIIKYIKDYFCDSAGGGCKHPYSGKMCSGFDVRGVNQGNWVVAGFNGSGEMECTCMPRVCPDHTKYCLGTDLGTDWCTLNCPQGSFNPDDYAPDPSGVCSGESFTQQNSCGLTRSATGTKDCSVANNQDTAGGTTGETTGGGAGGNPCEAVYSSLPSDSSSYSGEEKIAWYNDNGTTPQTLYDCSDTTAKDVEWMRNNGYKQ